MKILQIFLDQFVKPAIIICLISFVGLVAFYGIANEVVFLPSNLTRSAQQSEEFHEILTASSQKIDTELTRIASEPEALLIPTPSINSQNWLEIFLHKPTC